MLYIDMPSAKVSTLREFFLVCRERIPHPHAQTASERAKSATPVVLENQESSRLGEAAAITADPGSSTARASRVQEPPSSFAMVSLLPGRPRTTQSPFRLA
ncbi:hypothetical protein GCM10017688_02450 [Streptomyces ramulosus]